MKKPQLTLPQFSSINRNSLWLTTKIITLVSMTVLLFANDLTMLFADALEQEATSYILVVPIILAYLIYRKRKMLKAVLSLENTQQQKQTRYLPTIAGILLTLTAILLYWHGSYTFTPLEYHMLALPIFASGIVLILFNPQTLRQLAFPICFLFFLVPPPSEILYTIGATLSNLSSIASNTIINLIGIPSTLTTEYGNPTIIITRPDGAILNFTVDVACSGIYSLMGFFIFSMLIAYIIRDKTWKKAALILTGMPIIYLFNIVRITTILAIGYHYGETLALQVFHLLGGWVLIFIGTLLLLFISEKILKTKIFTTKPIQCPQCNPTPQPNINFCHKCGRIIKPLQAKIPKLGIIKVITVIATVLLLISIQAPVFALTQSPAVVITSGSTGQQVSTEILPKIPEYTLQFAYRDTDFEELAKQDMAIAYLYTPTNESDLPIWATLEIATARSALHRWETCLVNYPLQQGWKPKVIQIDLRDIQITENPPIISRYFVFTYTKTNLTQAVLYWYETSTFTINSTSQQKNVKISLIAYPENSSELAQIENKLVTIAKQITNYWEPIKIWSSITMILSQNGGYIAVATSILLALNIAIYTIKTRNQKKANRNAYEKLSTPNKQLIDTIKETEKTTIPTLDKIAVNYQETTGQPVTEDALLQKLAELEKTELIYNRIANKQDEPIHSWKTQI